MGTISKGILGGFSGKVGQVVGATWRGVTYMRSIGGKRTGPPTQAQLEQQEKFRLMVAFLRPFASLLSIGFKGYANQQTGVNAAVSYNLQNAVLGSSSPYNIDFGRILLSRGDLPGVSGGTAEPLAGGKVKFTWQNNTGIGTAKATDRCIPVVWGGEYNEAIFLIGGTSRDSQEMTLDCPSLINETVQTWLAFISADGRKVSTSVNTGTFNMLP